jgi:uncharacterized protein YjbI with pentapeptide repeats
MSNPEHLAILNQGVEIWNEWRTANPDITPDLRGADLHRTDLSNADLSDAHLYITNLSCADVRRARFVHAYLVLANLRCANLTGAHLIGANLREADLRRADLSNADLSGAVLIDADLGGAMLGGAILSGANLVNANLRDAYLKAANLRGANLSEASLREANLERADLSGARMSYTSIADTDLSDVIGLDAVEHNGPSSIGIDTLYESQGKIPDRFLRGAGVPEALITYTHSLVNTPFDFYSCFISYSEHDREFAERLHTDLEAKHVRCWLFSEDAKWGETVWGEIDRGIKRYDKLVVVCSENSLQSPAVLREIERGLQREDREKKNVLFPIRIDDYIFDKWEHERKADVVKKVVGDFRDWKNHDAYQESFARLLNDLQATDSKKV